MSAGAQPATGAQQVAVAAALPAFRACPPAGFAVSFSDSLDKLVFHGVELGGLSSLAYDARSAAWVSAVDNHGTDPARVWFFRNLAHPTVTRDPLVLRKPDGTAYHSRLTGLSAGAWKTGWLPYGCYNVHTLWCTL